MNTFCKMTLSALTLFSLHFQPLISSAEVPADIDEVVERATSRARWRG